MSGMNKTLQGNPPLRVFRPATQRSGVEVRSTMNDNLSSRHCSLCRVAGTPCEIKAPSAHIQDDSARGCNPGSDPARLAIYSYGLEYPGKVFCRDCFQTLLKVFAD